MQLPTKALTFTVDANTVIAFVARGSGIGVTFELWRQNPVGGANWDFLQLIGPTYSSEQQCDAAVVAEGGEVNFVKNKLLAALNALLKTIWPGNGTQPTQNVIDRLNAALADSFTFFRDVDNSVQVKAK